MESIDDVPAEIKKLIGPFIKRGKEMNEIQPLISYFCYLYSAQLIISSKTHLESEEVAKYIEILLNKIEDNKKTIGSLTPKLNEILLDKTKSFKLVLSFSLSIFNKSVNEINNHAASKNTVVSFMAFLNFIEVLNLWPDLKLLPENDLSKQIKYAKFHSNRILKAIKSNADPNDYITNDDETEISDFLSPSDEKKDDTVRSDTISDTDSTVPTLPEPPSEIKGEINLPTAPVLIKGNKNDLGLPSAPSNLSSSSESIEIVKPVLPEKPKIVTNIAKRQDKKIAVPVVDESKVLSREDVENFWSKEEIISSAQRKAKFAISALNYDDIETAIIELQSALDLLRGN